MHDERDLRLGELMAEAIAALDGDDAAAVDRALDAAGADRDELLGMVELALALRGPRRPDAAAIEALALDPAFDVRAWPEILAEARHASGIRRPDLVARLAERLGLRGDEQRRRLGDRYHELESGQIPPRGAQPPLVDALGDLLGGIGETLRATLRNPIDDRGGPALLFNRAGDEAVLRSQAHTLADAEPTAAREPTAAEREVDALFGL